MTEDYCTCINNLTTLKLNTCASNLEEYSKINQESIASSSSTTTGEVETTSITTTIEKMHEKKKEKHCCRVFKAPLPSLNTEKFCNCEFETQNNLKLRRKDLNFDDTLLAAIHENGLFKYISYFALENF